MPQIFERVLILLVSRIIIEKKKNKIARINPQNRNVKIPLVSLKLNVEPILLSLPSSRQSFNNNFKKEYMYTPIGHQKGFRFVYRRLPNSQYF